MQTTTTTTPRDAERAYMRALGHRVREARTLLGWSQEELARAANVSQGAVSRLESARGLATPLLVVRSIQHALAAGLARLEAQGIPVSSPLLGDAPTDVETATVVGDPTLTKFLLLYQQLAPADRRRALMVALAASGIPTQTEERHDA